MEERIRPSPWSIFEPLTEQEIEQLVDGSGRLEWGRIFYGPEDQTEMLAVYSDL